MRSRLSPAHVRHGATWFTLLAFGMMLLSLFSVVDATRGSDGPISSAQYQYDQYGEYGGKTTICHNGNTITISKHALPAHFRHGDTVGPCATPEKNPPGKTTPPGKNK